VRGVARARQGNAETHVAPLAFCDMPVNQFLLKPARPRLGSPRLHEGAFMSSSDRGRVDGPSADPDSSSAALSAAPRGEGGGDWLEPLQRSRPRHAAITRNLTTWSSYKTWAEQVRDSWESGAELPLAQPEAAAGK
jgi:hypothetical protein